MMIKKIISLILALMTVFSLGINVIAAELVPVAPEAAPKIIITISEATRFANVLYATMSGRYYIALDDEPYRDIRITTSGCLSAAMVEYDPEIMDVQGMDIIFGVQLGDVLVAGDMTYEQAKAYAKQLNEENNCTDYIVICLTNVNILEITTMDNYTPYYMQGDLRIDATVDGTEVTQTYTLIEDVTVFDLEEVKAAAKDFSYRGYLETGSKGYSDYAYDVMGDTVEQEDAAVISAAAFRAIEGESLRIYCGDLRVDLKNIAAGQKAVNLKHYGIYEADTDMDGDAESIQFGFYGDQIILGDFSVMIDTGYTWETLSKAFGINTEETPEVSYYVLKNGTIASQIRVNYDLADPNQDVVLDIFGSNDVLGDYEIVIDAPPIYRVFFNLEDGEWITRRFYQKTKDADLVIPKEAPTRKWHTFLGWATSEDAAEPEYYPGDVYTLNEDVDFYPVWKIDAEPKAKLSVVSTAAVAGGKGKIKINLSEPADATSIQFAVRYNTNFLDVVSCNSVLVPDATVNYSEDGMIYFVWDDVNALTEGGTLLEIEVEVPDYWGANDVAIDIVENRNIYEMIFANSSAEEFRVEVEDGTFKILEALYGDVDGNGKINVLDSNIIRRASARMVTLTDVQTISADVDGNGKVNVLDSNLVRRYAAKIIDKFPVEE